MSVNSFIAHQKNKNDSKKASSILRNYEANSRELIEALIVTKVTDVNFLILGNSLSSGYSMSDKIRIFFDQNMILRNQLAINNINCQIYPFSLVAGNSNGNILNLINSNRSLADVKRIFAHDLDLEHSVNNNQIIGSEAIKAYKKTGRVPVGSVRQLDYKEFYQINDEDDNIKIQDLLKVKKPGTQNIVILNGFTGELMDMIFRDGKIHLLPKYLKDEFRNMYAILKTIIAHDDEVMIIVGAIPEYSYTGGKIPVLGPVISLYNRAIKENVLSTTNSYLTKPINIGIFHNNQGHVIVDCHGNQFEYLALSNAFLATAADNYLTNRIFSSYYKTFKKHVEAYTLETNNKHKIDYGMLFSELNELLEISDHVNDAKLLAGLNKFKTYYNTYYHDDFYPTNKIIINDQLDIQRLILKNK